MIMKILCLHGFRTNALIMKTQLTAVVQQCPEHDFVFINAPNYASGPMYPEVQQWFGDQQTFEWYNGSCVEASLPISKNYLKNYFNTEGPFQAVIGFSQGAAICSWLMSTRLVNRVIVIGQVNIIQTFEKYTGSLLCMIGTRDPFIKGLEETANFYRNRVTDLTIVRYNQGHQIPYDPKSLETIKSFLGKVTVH